MLIRLLRQYLYPYRGQLAAVILLQLVAVTASLYLPHLNADIIDNGVTKGNVDYIWRIGLWMVLVSAVQGVCTFISVYLGAKAALASGRDIRGALLHKVGSFSAREVGKFGAPSLITRNTNDVQQVQLVVVMSCTFIVMAPIMCVGGVIMALRENLGLSWILLVAVPVLALTMTWLITRMVPAFRAMQTKIDAVNRVLREQITGIRVVRAFVREDLEVDRFEVANADLTSTALKVGRYMVLMFPLVMTISNITSVAVIWFGGHQIDAGHAQIGTLSAMLSYVMQILMAVLMGSFLAMIAPRATVCAERIYEVLDTDSSVLPPKAPIPFQTTPGIVEFADVAFAYPGAESPVLRGITFRAEPGEVTAIVGATGSGKTTLLNLIPRLIDVTEGSVRVGGADVRELDLELMRSEVGLVPQKAYLFSGTVASNLRYGNPDATDEQLWRALEIAQAADFVRAMPDGLETAVAQGGTTVSGGQRQRLAIARALVKKPRVYLFDDSFSALDFATDAALRDALAPTVAEATVFIVAQRISTIRNADRIIVLDDGVTVGMGTHDQLLLDCPTYAEIVDSQLGLNEATGGNR